MQVWCVYSRKAGHERRIFDDIKCHRQIALLVPLSHLGNHFLDWQRWTATYYCKIIARQVTRLSTCQCDRSSVAKKSSSSTHTFTWYQRRSIYTFPTMSVRSMQDKRKLSNLVRNIDHESRIRVTSTATQDV